MNTSRECSLLFCAQSDADNLCYYLVESTVFLEQPDICLLSEILQAEHRPEPRIQAAVIGPRRELVSPWSTNATDILKNVGLTGIYRVEQFHPYLEGRTPFDAMVQEIYPEITPDMLSTDLEPAPPQEILDLESYNREAGLALSGEEIEYLQKAAKHLGRPLSDSEVFGFAQVNSEHCRHKIFNGEFVLDGVPQEKSLFALIKETSSRCGHNLVSAYKDNVAFIKGPPMLQFAPASGQSPSLFELQPIESVIALKAETHNYPTSVEPFAGAATGSGGEIRDRIAGGTGSIPLAGTAVYMTAYPRLASNNGSAWTEALPARPWQYQSPEEILIKASDGASDFGNKFGQPLIVGSVLTFEAQTPQALYAYDKCIMLAGGVGFANASHALKRSPKAGDLILILGGDNYRIGMGGGAVSSVKSGEYRREIELDAVQRANAEMQKRVFNVTRALAEDSKNPIILIHDHGAGGHMNCLTELMEESGGIVHINRLPLGDKTLSVREILCNESQERMGLVVAREDLERVQALCVREKAPCYLVGEINNSMKIVFTDPERRPAVDLPIKILLGNSPRTVLKDQSLQDQNLVDCHRAPLFAPRNAAEVLAALSSVLSLEAVACKDWLTNKVDRSVSGKVVQQQCVGPLQLPLANLGVVALDYSSEVGVATAIGHAPAAALLDETAGSLLSLAEALTNIIWAPLKNGLETVSLSANWMWPCKRPGEDVRLYRAVQALSESAIALGIPVPTGKDSLSMTTQYADGLEVRSPGTVIISAVAEVSDIYHCVTPDLKPTFDSVLIYVNLSSQSDNFLGGSALAQTLSTLGDRPPTVEDLPRFKSGLNLIQTLIAEGKILAGHDVSGGGVITSLCEMAFSGDLGINLDLQGAAPAELGAWLFCEKPGVILQVTSEQSLDIQHRFGELKIETFELGQPLPEKRVRLQAGEFSFDEDLSTLRRKWFGTSTQLDALQTAAPLATHRFENFDQHPLRYSFPAGFSGVAADYGVCLTRADKSRIRAAIIREQGINGDREMAFSLFAAGFDVLDLTMTDLISGREDLRQLSFIVFPGGFSYSDVLGAGRGWAAAFVHNPGPRRALEDFFARADTLSLGVCNGCQTMAALEPHFNMLYPDHTEKVSLKRNSSNKFESIFLNVEVGSTQSVLLQPLQGSRLGVWVAHGEGCFSFPRAEADYDIPIKYCASSYPANPSGSQFNAAALCSADGRHLLMMPHLERSILPFQWGYYPENREKHEVTPWILAFTSARKWIQEHGR
ncbi:MAG: phosphoribosylformylglycinamidine synthase [Deltaproteobacteria bacterium]|nr:phosphoribosylformylglycinamidine synthase [Deltaproteobacteria bacterium]